tara:strand:+ start:2808 stop:5243 length:2436 start_codon:yes stop_codon:yes gene_type:complete
MNRKVQIYVATKRYQGALEDPNLKENERLELFDDEQINVVSTVQNIQDISKTFTDFSQSFTIPASTRNNSIFQHFYQSDVNASIDYNLRLEAFIEIDLSFFRRGKLQIEKANLKNGKPESYTVTFYGDGKTLKDYFGEDLLSDLDYTPYNHDYTQAEFLNRIEDGTNAYDVKYPLITSNRVWSYGAEIINATTPSYITPATLANDISINAGAINREELFPALRVSSIFSLIQQKYGVTFEGNFLSDESFTKLFLWFKNSIGYAQTGSTLPIDFTSKIQIYNTVDLLPFVNLTTNAINVSYKSIATSGFPSSHQVILKILTVSNSSLYYVDLYENGILINSYPKTGTGNITLVNLNNVSGLNNFYSFNIRATSSAIVITSELEYIFYCYVFDPDPFINAYVLSTSNVEISNASMNFLSLTNLSINCPKMKVSDFFAGILKQFNATCVSTAENVYYIAPLDDWYDKGKKINISRFVDIENIEVAKMPLYKKISLEFEKSESILNKQFIENNNRGYGDAVNAFDYDGGDFIVKLPFENLLQQTFTGTDLQVGYSLTKELASYVPKPTLFYQYDNQACSFKFQSSGGPVTVSTYTPFGQDLFKSFENYTLNFSPEFSSLLLEPIFNTQYQSYYFGYLSNLYNLKQRLVRVKAKLSLSLLTGLKLNDRLIIRDKRYIINEMKSNLTTGEVDFSLYLDFRSSLAGAYVVPGTGGTIPLAISLPNGTESVTIGVSSEEITLSKYFLTEDEIIRATMPAAPVDTVSFLELRYTNDGGEITNERINIITVAQPEILTADSTRLKADSNITIDQSEAIITK